MLCCCVLHGQWSACIAAQDKGLFALAALLAMIMLLDDDADPPPAKPIPGLSHTSHQGKPQIARWGVKQLQSTPMSDDESQVTPDKQDDISHVRDSCLLKAKLFNFSPS